MAVRLALAGARVEGSTATYDKVSVVGRTGPSGDEIVLSAGGNVLATLTAAAAERVAADSWAITSDQGSFTATIIRGSGCGCGR